VLCLDRKASVSNILNIETWYCGYVCDCVIVYACVFIYIYIYTYKLVYLWTCVLRYVLSEGMFWSSVSFKHQTDTTVICLSILITITFPVILYRVDKIVVITVTLSVTQLLGFCYNVQFNSKWKICDYAGTEHDTRWSAVISQNFSTSRGSISTSEYHQVFFELHKDTTR